MAFLDILGYQSFMENNQAGKAAATVLKVLNLLPHGIPELTSSFMPKSRDEFRRRLSRIKWLVFSDSILLTLAYRDRDAPELRKGWWLIFLLNLTYLYWNMLRFGLPIRGAVSCGEFTVGGNCFAGVPIIDAYRTGNALDVSAVALTASGTEELRRLSEAAGNGALAVLTAPYRFPMKSCERRQLTALMPCFSLPTDQPDIRRYVSGSFSAHGKDVPQGAVSKLDNTVSYIQDVFKRRAKLFPERPAGES